MKWLQILITILLSVSNSQSGENNTDSEISKSLNELLSAKEIEQYRTYFLLMPKAIDISGSCAADIIDINNRRVSSTQTLYKFYPYKLSDPEQCIALTTNPELYAAGMRERSIFVTLSKINVNVPVRTAEKITNGFTNGLATFLFLNEHVKPAIAKIKPDAVIDLDLSLEGKYLVEPSVYNSAGSFILSASTTTGEIDNQIDIIDLNARIEMAGILLGWEAGVNLEKLRVSNEPAYQAALKIISARFTPETMGQAVSYTLTVLQAAGSVEAAVKAGWATVGGDTPENQATAGKGFTEILATFREKSSTPIKQDEINKPSDLTSLCFELTLGNIISDEGDLESRQRQLGFLRGYLNGSQSISREIINYAMVQGYTAGYAKGASDGYEAGLAAGKIAGTKAGREDGYKAGSDAVAKLSDALRKVKASGTGDFFGGVLAGFTGALFKWKF